MFSFLNWQLLGSKYGVGMMMIMMMIMVMIIVIMLVGSRSVNSCDSDYGDVNGCGNCDDNVIIC